ncbi:hypothetical protein NUW54_g9602 [Trametes sanguinea]|uniref:Uncharacterized protein n=1 Tax=Trametes sanguinea TaxID=158606 RepID=A0ACC1P5G8_9APHY|nr:hypothetical protein NUW54_g9602 [Trametes sanguinea]
MAVPDDNVFKAPISRGTILQMSPIRKSLGYPTAHPEEAHPGLSAKLRDAAAPDPAGAVPVSNEALE